MANVDVLFMKCQNRDISVNVNINTERGFTCCLIPNVLIKNLVCLYVQKEHALSEYKVMKINLYLREEQ
jgi:hypothetical protein